MSETSVSEQDIPAPNPNDFEIELTQLVSKYQLNAQAPSVVLARYLIRQLDNFRETLQERDDDIRIQSRMASATEGAGNN